MNYSESVQSQYDWSTIAPSEAIVKALASIENIKPANLSVDSTLYDHVDPEALDALIAEDNPISVSFTAGDYKIQIDGKTLYICFNWNFRR